MRTATPISTCSWMTLCPWSATYQDGREGSLIPGVFRELVFWEVMAFLASVVVAYVYAWRKGVFKWR